MARYKTKRFVLESVWDEQWVECEADSIEEAERKFEQHEGVEVTHSEMGDVLETIRVDIELPILLVKESDNG